jgi:hypothetical protein
MRRPVSFTNIGWIALRLSQSPFRARLRVVIAMVIL